MLKRWSALSFTAVLVAAACTSGGGASPSVAPSAAASASPAATAEATAPAEPVTIKFATYAWQPATVAATEKIVADWNAANPNIQVEIVTIDVNSVHDALVTQFQGGTAADIIHDEGADLAGFVNQGFLADMTNLVPAELKSDVPQGIWDAITYDGKIYAAPTLLQSYVVFANADQLAEAGVELPTLADPWTWDEFAATAKQLTTGGKYGLGWGLKSATALVMSTSLNFNGTFFYDEGGKTVLKFGEAEQQVPRRIHEMAYTDESIDPVTIGSSGSDNLAGFIGGKFSMFVGGNFYAQQLTEQAPDTFNWVMLPLLKGDTQTQNANPQTLSIATQSKYPEQAMQFISYFTAAENLSALAQGDWLAPATTSGAESLLADTGGEDGWDVVAESAKSLGFAPFQKLEDYPQWKTQIATPAFQQFFAGEIDLETLGTQLTDGWTQVSGG